MCRQMRLASEHCGVTGQWWSSSWGHLRAWNNSVRCCCMAVVSLLLMLCQLELLVLLGVALWLGHSG
eukprot:scaffold15094_cov45-Cyclotella_meneghiniana.AAC.1